MSKSNNLDFFYNKFLSEETKKKSEKIIVFIAIFSFLIHLCLIAMVNLKILELNDYSKLLTNPIAAIYTPFSFILIYEVYLLLFYLPKSTSIYIGKQYEIISLIVIRRIFKDLSNIKLTKDWFNNKYDVLFVFDIVAIVILFYLIFWFYRLNDRNIQFQKEKFKMTPEITSFINIKKIVATCLVPVFLILSIYSFGSWINESFFSITELVKDIKDINKIFFDDFFTILILVEVLLLLFSFLQTEKFSKVIRNSGFIISTILLKISFGSEGIINTILIVVAVSFGVLILAIHNKYEIIKEEKS